MTLIVGIKCLDGAVIAADSAATLTVDLGPTTVCQKCTKLSAVGDLVIGTSGPVGLGQSFRDEIEANLKGQNNRCPWHTQHAAKEGLSKAMWKHAKEEWERAETVSKTIGPQAAHSVMSSTLVALPIAGAADLIQFDFKSSPEAASDGLPFVSIGSGQPFADPFLAFVRSVLWPDGLPSLQQGVLYALWAVEEAITLAPSGLGFPVQVFTLAKPGNQWTASQLSDDELGEHRQAIQDIKEALRTACKALWTECGDTVCSAPPEPP